MEKLENEIKTLAHKLALKKQKLAAIKETARRSKERKDRRLRAAKIHRLGAIIEKMGLDQLDDELFLGALVLLHGTLERGDPAVLEQYRQEGRPFLAIGKKLPTIIGSAEKTERLGGAA